MRANKVLSTLPGIWTEDTRRNTEKKRRDWLGLHKKKSTNKIISGSGSGRALFSQVRKGKRGHLVTWLPDTIKQIFYYMIQTYFSFFFTQQKNYFIHSRPLDRFYSGQEELDLEGCWFFFAKPVLNKMIGKFAFQMFDVLFVSKAFRVY